MSFLALNTDCLGLIFNQLGIKELTQLAQVNRRLSGLVSAHSGYRWTVQKFSDCRGLHDRFHWLCRFGYLTLAQTYWRDHPQIDLHINQDWTFRLSCSNGHKEVAKWLWSLDGKIDLHGEQDRIFRLSCSNGRWEIAKWLSLVSRNQR